ncbi:hypothetical protein COLO4_02410 [Corchorus olitorius]|uniref:Uncharacterized protein n=1 Tax=Corchorus olitorius TaxID=93759 RepID=A0A1R3L105_9ROSI|nr:hypothetical protein COLO4_02410 [Corchorus olitorius]
MCKANDSPTLVTIRPRLKELLKVSIDAKKKKGLITCPAYFFILVLVGLDSTSSRKRKNPTYILKLLLEELNSS